MQAKTIVGAVVIGLGLGWLLWPKKKAEVAASSAVPLPPGPPPPPSSPPPPGVQGVGEWDGQRFALGQSTVYVIWRLFVWNGNQWVLEDTQEHYMESTMLRAPWPLLLPEGVTNQPPWYYSDSWSWGGGKVPEAPRWRFEGCDTSFTTSPPWC